MQEEREDRLLFAAQAAELAGIKARTFRKYVSMELAPPPDDPDEDRPLARRMPRWRESTIRHWMQHRIGQGRRTDLSGGRPYARGEGVQQ